MADLSKHSDGVQPVATKSFTPVEARHLLHLIEVNEREAWYTGNPGQYWQRSANIRAKLRGNDLLLKAEKPSKGHRKAH